MFSFPVFLGAVVCSAATAVTVWDNAPVIGGKVFVEGDTWWHVAVGERILSSHTWPSSDPYSFTAHGTSWIAYEWLGEVMMAIIERLGGLRGLTALLVLLAICIGLLIYLYAWTRSGNMKAAAVATVLVLPMAAASFTMRPQLLGYIFLLVTLICLERFQQGHPRSLWILPGVFILWVNTHASFALGFLVMGAYSVSSLVDLRYRWLVSDLRTASQRRELLLVSCLCLPAVAVTPYVIHLVGYLLDLTFRQSLVMQVNDEWQRLDLTQPYSLVFLALLVAAVLMQVTSPVAYRLPVLLILLFGIIESCLHARFLIFFAIVFAPALSTHLAGWFPPYRSDRDHPIVNAFLVTAAAFGIIALFPSRARLEDLRQRAYPVGAVEYLRQHQTLSRMFNDDMWGGYLIWSLPAHRVFIDDRFDIYESGGILSDYYRFAVLHENPERFVQKYDLQSALVRQGGAVGHSFQALQGWSILYQDSTSTIFVRANRTPPSNSVVNTKPDPPEIR